MVVKASGRLVPRVVSFYGMRSTATEHTSLQKETQPSHLLWMFFLVIFRENFFGTVGNLEIRIGGGLQGRFNGWSQAEPSNRAPCPIPNVSR